MIGFKGSQLERDIVLSGVHWYVGLHGKLSQPGFLMDIRPRRLARGPTDPCV